MQIEIRTALVADAAEVKAIHGRAARHWPESRPELDAHPEAIPDPLPEIRMGRIRVAISDRRILGFSAARPSAGDHWELTGLFTDPDAMGCGVGRALVADVKRRAAAAGAEALEVIVNENARGFYEKLDFRTVGPAQTLFGPAQRLRVDFGAT